MADNLETQTAVEPLTEYCRTCGHSKDSHNLDFKGAPNRGSRTLRSWRIRMPSHDRPEFGRSLHLRGVEQLGLRTSRRSRKKAPEPGLRSACTAVNAR